MSKLYYASLRSSLMLVLAACGDDAATILMDGDVPTDIQDACACDRGLPVRAGTIDVADELSGLTISRSLPDTIWAHNDSGDIPRLFALSPTGTSRAVVTITNAMAIDWEDIASGTCNGAPCVVVADIGDNELARASVRLYEIDEPAALTTPLSLAARGSDITYPDGAHNSEALFVDSLDEASYVITKQTTNAALVYRMPRGGGVAAQVGSLVVPGADPRVTSADLIRDACGVRLLVRTYVALFELRAGPAASIDDLLAAPLVAVPAANEAQGEAVAYLPDGRGYVTASEGEGEPLWRVTCQ